MKENKKPEYTISIPHKEEGSDKTFWVPAGAAFVSGEGDNEKLIIKVKVSSLTGEYVAFKNVEKKAA